MRVVSVALAILTVGPAILTGNLAQASDLGKHTFMRGALQAKAQYCTDCHGASGKGYRGFYTMPRLAGQTTAYLENQLDAFAEHRRQTNTVLKISKVHSALSPDTREALAQHFSDLEVRPAAGGPAKLVDAGKKIFDEGMPDANIPACSVCHGPDAMGDGVNPRLAGQLYPYLVK